MASLVLYLYGNLCAWGKQYVSKEEKTLYADFTK